MQLFKTVPIVMLALLAACGTPQQQCIASATQDLRVVNSLIRESEEILRRGYGFKTVNEIEYVSFSCKLRDGTMGVCTRPVVEETRYPVSVNLDEEAKKLESLKRKQAELAAQAQPLIAQCRAQFPE